MRYLFAFIYAMLGIGYGMAVSDREPSAFNWVATMSGMFFPLFVGFLLGQHLHTVKVKETDT